jgi:hypothetical protein
MNSWKFNSTARHILALSITNFFKIPYSNIYKKVKEINEQTGIIITDDGKKYKLTLEEINEN